ncbi:MAG: hypothetical protein ABR529_04890 [Actinomycetota bacterium]
MAKRLGISGAVVALLALAIGVVSPALSSAKGGDRTIRVVSVNTEEEFVDVGAEGFSLGDEFVFASDLSKHGKKVGHTGVVCTFTSLARGEIECVATASFRGGQIAGQGLVAGEPQSFALPITGGSGKFEGAEGELHVQEVTESKEILTFHLNG